MYRNSIKTWAEDDRPREKMLLKGERALSNAELIAILIGSGTTKETAVELAKRILIDVHNDISALAKLTVKELMFYKGIGEAKAISIKSALELGKRRQLYIPEKKKSISSSAEVFDIVTPYLQDKKIEEFWVLLLNRRNHLMGMKMISAGGVSSTVVDAKIVYKYALDKLASGIILVHNHPSGCAKKRTCIKFFELLQRVLQHAYGDMLY